MVNFWRKRWVNPFGKMSVFWLFEPLFFYRLDRCFFVLEYRKIPFPCLYCLKKEHGKLAKFWPNLWANPFGKMLVFLLFEAVVFIAYTGVFSFKNMVKHIFLAYIAWKKKLKKWPIFNQNHGLTPLEKTQFFDFLKLLFL